MAIEEELGRTYRAYYCHGGMAICARYMVFQELGKPSVPPDLYPDQASKAKQIIAAAPKPTPKCAPFKA